MSTCPAWGSRRASSSTAKCQYQSCKCRGHPCCGAPSPVCVQRQQECLLAPQLRGRLSLMCQSTHLDGRRGGGRRRGRVVAHPEEEVLRDARAVPAADRHPQQVPGAAHQGLGLEVQFCGSTLSCPHPGTQSALSQAPPTACACHPLQTPSFCTAPPTAVATAKVHIAAPKAGSHRLTLKAVVGRCGARAPEPDLEAAVRVVLHLHVGELEGVHLRRRQLPRGRQVPHCQTPRLSFPISAPIVAGDN